MCKESFNERSLFYIKHYIQYKLVDKPYVHVIEMPKNKEVRNKKNTQNKRKQKQKISKTIQNKQKTNRL